jgi:hypothetical protein
MKEIVELKNKIEKLRHFLIYLQRCGPGETCSVCGIKLDFGRHDGTCQLRYWIEEL